MLMKLNKISCFYETKVEAATGFMPRRQQ